MAPVLEGDRHVASQSCWWRLVLRFGSSHGFTDAQEHQAAHQQWPHTRDKECSGVRLAELRMCLPWWLSRQFLAYCSLLLAREAADQSGEGEALAVGRFVVGHPGIIIIAYGLYIFRNPNSGFQTKMSKCNPDFKIQMETPTLKSRFRPPNRNSDF